MSHNEYTEPESRLFCVRSISRVSKKVYSYSVYVLDYATTQCVYRVHTHTEIRNGRPFDKTPQKYSMKKKRGKIVKVVFLNAIREENFLYVKQTSLAVIQPPAND